MLLQDSRTFGALWVLLVALVYGVVCQELTVNDTTTAMPPTPLDCVNGMFNGTVCVCLTGWTGQLCDTCMRSRLRLTEASGLIFDGGENYQPSSQCLFYIEANSSVRAIHLRVRSFHTECQWDALNVFNGDSIFHPKIAAYTGDIIELPLEEPFSTEAPNATNSTMEPVPVQYQDPREITLSGSGSQMLLYFYTDASAQRSGFEIAYWLDYYGCPDNCSARGVCENGVCVCEEGWMGRFCHIEVCPNNCSGNGVCDTNACVCSMGYTGADCSIDISTPYWQQVSAAPLPTNLTLSTIARASHSAVTWGDHMIVYGGYQFPAEDYYFRPEPPVNETVQDVEPQVSILQYEFSTRSWEEVLTYPSVDEDAPSMNGTNETSSDDPVVPQARYGHTAVVYNDTMYVFGGALLPSEQIINEFWALDLNNLTWTLISNPVPSENTTDQPTPTLQPSTASVLESMPDPEPLPLPVRSHTSHVVGNKMVTLFGLSSGRSTFISYVQEYDFVTGTWSLPHMSGAPVNARMGHTSVYDPVTGKIYVHGGALISRGVGLLLGVNALDTTTYTWTRLSSSGPPRFLHSSVLLGPLLVTYGGCETDTNELDCFKNDTHAFNILCNSWEKLTIPGLPGNSSRYGHSSVVDASDGNLLVFGGFLGTFHHDLLRLSVGNCTQFTSEEACVNGSGLCAWSGAGECVSVSSASVDGNFTYQCQVDPCLRVPDCTSCNQLANCLWIGSLTQCQTNPNISIFTPLVSDCVTEVEDSCSFYTQCSDCENHGCSWGNFNNSGVAQCAATGSDFFTEVGCSTDTSCFAATSCSSCLSTTSSSCLWCPSLSQCVPSYPLTYIYAQCLGWINQRCPEDCTDYKTCGDCESDTRCGWCNDPSDTGLGTCFDGGFTGPRTNGTCEEVDGLGRSEMWNFEQCPACQCNGHSSCVNESICEECQNNTAGDQCQDCVLGYFGDARNGGNCTECDCNGYNDVCDTGNGNCVCNSFFVDGDHCELCQTEHRGDADNFCYARLSAGFIYRFTVTEDREREGFFVVTPSEDKNLHFRLDVTSNSRMEQPLVLQLFLGKRSENLWVLANLTDPMLLNQGESFDGNYVAFTSNPNSSFARFFTFANPSIQNTSNYTDLLIDNSENEYTSQQWNGDVSLVIHVYNLTNPSEFRITVDQQDLLFLLYFFATFTICFSVLLLVFLGGWYIKRKIEYRHFVRQQYIEMQRRVARPFARLKAVIAPVPPPTPDSPPPAQHPSYVAVETCQSGKAAVLSLFVRLPGNHSTGRPCPGRSGLAIASTLVSVNPSSKKTKEKSKKKGQREGSTSEDDQQEQSGRRSGRSRNRIRLREVNSSSITTNT